MEIELKPFLESIELPEDVLIQKEIEIDKSNEELLSQIKSNECKLVEQEKTLIELEVVSQLFKTGIGAVKNELCLMRERILDAQRRYNDIVEPFNLLEDMRRDNNKKIEEVKKKFAEVSKESQTEKQDHIKECELLEKDTEDTDFEAKQVEEDYEKLERDTLEINEEITVILEETVKIESDMREANIWKIQAEIDIYEREVLELEEVSSKLKTKLDDNKKILADIDPEIERMTGDFVAAETEEKDLTNKIEKMEQEFKNDKETLLNHICDIADKEREKIVEQNFELAFKLKTILDENISIEDEINVKSTRIENLKEAIKREKEAIECAEQEIEQQKLNAKSIPMINPLITDEIQNLNHQIKRAKFQLFKLKLKLESKKIKKSAKKLQKTSSVTSEEFHPLEKIDLTRNRIFPQDKIVTKVQSKIKKKKHH